LWHFVLRAALLRATTPVECGGVAERPATCSEPATSIEGTGWGVQRTALENGLLVREHGHVQDTRTLVCLPWSEEVASGAVNGVPLGFHVAATAWALSYRQPATLSVACLRYSDSRRCLCRACVPGKFFLHSTSPLAQTPLRCKLGT